MQIEIGPVMTDAFELVVACFVFLLLRLTVATINLFSNLRIPRNAAEFQHPLVSILIPARNEEFHLPQILSDLQTLSYSNWEAWICNDHSTDATEDVLKNFSHSNSRIRWFDSEDLPEGSLGKPWACRQLSERAQGRYLLFLDADVRVHSDFIEQLVLRTQRKSLALLSVFPRQILGTWGEWLSVPLMTTILTTLLPLFLIDRSHRAAFAAANGQCMFFDAPMYRKHRFHDLARSQKVDDIFIQREVKKLRLRTETLLGDERIECRMYRGFREARLGFAKNVHAFFGNSTVGLFAYIAVTTLPPIALALLSRWDYLGIYLAGEITLKAEVSALARTSFFKGLVLSLPQHFGFIVIAISATIRRWSKTKLEWKGRTIV